MTMLVFALVWCANAPLDIEVVTSPKDPGAYTIDFKEDLRFGAEEDGDEYLWTDGSVPASFSIDPRGHFFVADGKSSQIFEFDTDGKFIQVFAQKGQGPGEFQNLSRFQILADGRAVGFDSLQGTTRFSYYDQKLKYEKTETKTGFDQIIVRPTFAPDSFKFYAWFISFDTEANKMKFKTGLFNADRELMKELSTQEWPVPDQTRVQDPSMWEDYLASQFEGLLNRGTVLGSFLTDGSILIADAKNFQIQRWDTDLKTQTKTIKKDYEPIPYTEEDKEALVTFIEDTIFAQGGSQLSSIITKNVIQRAVEKANLPAYKNPIIAIVPMEDNKFAVLRDANFGTGSYKAVFFDENGKSMGTFNGTGPGVHSFFGTRLLFRNGFAYTMEKTEEGDNQMVRYQYDIVKK